MADAVEAQAFADAGQTLCDLHVGYESVSSASFLVALPVGHALAGHQTLTARQLADVELIDYAVSPSGDDLGLDFVRRIQPARQRASSRYRADSTLSVLALVAAGAGLAVVPAGVDLAGVPNVVFRPLAEPDVTVEFHLLHRNEETDPAVAVFLHGYGLIEHP
ncbi:MAG TPA: LysR substrate-binding domain-containing protein [Pseudonocardiaceae bacterium]|nr:LysR substrate-binding domain-containing protein [Pseudonocardiaceae bacterium]